MKDIGSLFGVMLLGVIVLLLVINVLPAMITGISTASTTSGISSGAQSVVRLNMLLVAFVPMAIVAGVVFFALESTGVLDRN